MREVVRTAKAIMVERGKPLSEWTTALPVVQWVLNTAWRKSINTTPNAVMMGREPGTVFAALAEDAHEGWQVDPSIDGFS